MAIIDRWMPLLPAVIRVLRNCSFKVVYCIYIIDKRIIARVIEPCYLVTTLNSELLFPFPFFFLSFYKNLSSPPQTLPTSDCSIPNNFDNSPIYKLSYIGLPRKKEVKRSRSNFLVVVDKRRRQRENPIF